MALSSGYVKPTLPLTQAHSWRQSELTKPRLASFVTWFRSAISVSPNVSTRSDDFPVPLEAHLMKMLAKMKADTDEDLVLLMLAAFRALGWKSRLVINFVILPLKPPKDDGAGPAKSSDKKPADDINTEAADPKPSTSKTTTVKKKKKSSCKNSRKSMSDKESFIIDQLDGSNDIEHDSSVRRSSKSRASREKEGPKRKVRYEDDEEDVSPPKKTRSSSSHSSSKSLEGNNNKKDDFKEPNDAKNSRSTNGQKSRRHSKSSASTLSSEALAEAARRSSSRSRPAKAMVDRKGSDSEEDFDSMVEAPTTRQKSISVKTKTNAKAAKKSVTLSSSTKMTDYFIEVLVKGEWVCVDAMRARTDCAEEMEAKASKPMLYVLACNADSTVKDVTMRYAKNYMTDARKKRIDQVSSTTGFILLHSHLGI